MARKKVLHLKSNVVNDGLPKLPTSGQVEYGEIAINYGDGAETLAIRNSEDEIVTFSNDNTIIRYVDNAVSANTKDEVSIKYSGDPDPSSASTIEIYIDDTIDPVEVEVYTQSETDAIVSGAVEDMKEYVDEAISGATLDKEVTVKYSGDPDPSSASTIEIYVDDTIEPAEIDIYTRQQVDALISGTTQVIESGESTVAQAVLVVDENATAEEEVYSQAQVDRKIADVVEVTDETSGYTATMVVDESTDLEVDFYTTTQVDAIADALRAYVDSAVTGNTIVQTTGNSTTVAMSQNAVTTALSNKADSSALTGYATETWVGNQNFEKKIEITTADSASLTAEVNKYYRYDTAIGTLAITLPVPSDTTYLSSIIFSFTTTSGTPSITFTSSATIKYQDGWAIDASSLYEINAVYNGSYWALAAIKLT